MHKVQINVTENKFKKQKAWSRAYKMKISKHNTNNGDTVTALIELKCS